MTAARQLPDTVLVGRIRRPHGVRGEVVVEVLSDHPERFQKGRRVIASWPERGPAVSRELEVDSSRPHRKVLLVTFAGVDDRDGAEALRGADLEVSRALVPPAEPDAYYHYELLGCRCIDAVAGELGEVVDLIEDGGGLLLLVEGAQGQLPIPFVKAFLRGVDIEAGVIELTLPEGLVEICRSQDQPES